MKLKRQTIEMWGSTYKFTPVLVTEIFGDGKQWIKFFPMMYRPLFYLVRVDSKWDESNHGEDPIVDHTDEIWEAIEDEFGVCCEERGDCPCDGYELFPCTSDTSGSVWATLNEHDVKKLLAKQPLIHIASMVAKGGVSALHSPVPVAIGKGDTYTSDSSVATCEACIKILREGRIA